jgi:hypothetical protein
MSRRTVITTSAALSALAVAAPTLAATAFLPGVYETKTAYADGTKETSRHCATSKGVGNDTLEKRLAAMTNANGCTYSQKSIGGGKYAIAGTCNQDGIRSSVKQSGTYTPTSMTMNMAMTLAMPKQKPVSMSFTAVSRRVAATCPADMTEE